MFNLFMLLMSEDEQISLRVTRIRQLSVIILS
jgi:hypothetical protein